MDNTFTTKQESQGEVATGLRQEYDPTSNSFNHAIDRMNPVSPTGLDMPSLSIFDGQEDLTHTKQQLEDAKKEEANKKANERDKNYSISTEQPKDPRSPIHHHTKHPVMPTLSIED